MSEASPRPPLPPTLRFVLVCHGEVEDRGAPDAALTPRGREEAAAIAADLKQTQPGVSAVYSSPLPASLATAVTLAKALRLPEPQSQDGLSGATSEDLTAMQERCWKSLEELREQHGPEGVVLLVSGELPLRTLICRALSIPLQDMERFRLEPASVSALEFRGQRTILAALNDICHLR